MAGLNLFQVCTVNVVNVNCMFKRVLNGTEFYTCIIDTVKCIVFKINCLFMFNFMRQA